jgi:hypothetical protein
LHRIRIGYRFVSSTILTHNTTSGGSMLTTINNRRIDDEETSAILLKDLLLQNNYPVIYLKGDEPPDYWFQIGSDRFAVEVVSITDSLDENSILNYIKRDIEYRFSSQNEPLPGSFVISVSGKPAIRDFYTKGQFSKSIEEICTNIKKLEKCGTFTITGKGRNRLDIIRGTTDESHISIMRSTCSWEEDSVISFYTRIKDAIERKAYKLRKVEEPWILLLFCYSVDCSPDVITAAYEKIEQSVKSCSEFHTIAFVHERKVYIGKTSFKI